VASGLAAPVAIRHALGDRRLFIVDLDGRVGAVDPSTSARTVFLDTSRRIVALDPAGDGRGLLGLAFHPGF
jgi:hypothetical protein